MGISYCKEKGIVAKPGFLIYNRSDQSIKGMRTLAEKRSVSITEIARQAGVSAATVSRVFRGGYVREDTRQVILAIAREHGYQPRVYKKQMSPPHHDTVIGVVVADLGNPFFQKIIRAISDVFDQHGVGIIVCDNNENPTREVRNLSLLKQLNVNGMIIAPISENEAYNSAYIKELYDGGLPVIVLDRDVKGIGLSGVFQNSYEAAYHAVDTLISCGHEHIATVSGPITSKPGLDRMVGYMDALKHHGIAVRQEYILYGNFKMESGYTLTRQLLAAHPQVTAVFSANNMMSIGALRAIREAGLSVPGDIAFISYGMLNPYDQSDSAGISQLIEPTEMMGHECAQLMLEKMSASKKDSRVVKRVSFDVTLDLRGSEICPKNRRSAVPEAK